MRPALRTASRQPLAARIQEPVVSVVHVVTVVVVL